MEIVSVFNYQEYYHKLTEMIKSKTPVWQAIVTYTDGSTPAAVGMHLAVTGDRTPLGNLGGGELEHKVIDFIRHKQPSEAKILTVSLNKEGLVDEAKDNPATGNLQTGMICGGSATIYIEPLFHSNKLFIVGGGHCGKALAKIAHLCGFYVTVVDNRTDQLSPEFYPQGVELVFSSYDDLDKIIPFSEQIYLVIMTYGHQFDEFVLQKCLSKDCRYLGMIGSKEKVKQTFETLKKKGYQDEDLQKVSAPVGLPIGSKTPYEIAVSVTAELIKVRSSSD